MLINAWRLCFAIAPRSARFSATMMPPALPSSPTWSQQEASASGDFECRHTGSSVHLFLKPHRARTGATGDRRVVSTLVNPYILEISSPLQELISGEA